MTIRQTILKWVYPLLMKSAKGASENAILYRPAMEKPPVSFFQLMANDIWGKPFLFETLRGKKTLLVNTASNCGYAAQLAELQELFQKNERYLNIVGIPSNDFKNQEQLQENQIMQFCRKNYGVTFPMLQKAHVRKESNQSALYQWLSQPDKNGWNRQAPGWNYWKYLVDEDGALLACFPTGISSKNEKLTTFLRND